MKMLVSLYVYILIHVKPIHIYYLTPKGQKSISRVEAFWKPEHWPYLNPTLDGQSRHEAYKAESRHAFLLTSFACSRGATFVCMGNIISNQAWLYIDCWCHPGTSTSPSSRGWWPRSSIRPCRQIASGISNDDKPCTWELLEEKKLCSIAPKAPCH